MYSIKNLFFNKLNRELIEIEHLITEIKLISNKKHLKLKQFNKESLTYLKSLLLQGKDYNTALVSATKYQENYIATLQSLPINRSTFNSYLTSTRNNIKDAKELCITDIVTGIK